MDENLKLGDEANPGTPGTGEDLCSCRHGKGSVEGHPYSNCDGTSVITRGLAADRLRSAGCGREFAFMMFITTYFGFAKM